MKKFILFALVATMFAACVTDGVNEPSAVIEDLAPETLTVSFEGEESRIQLQNGKTVWTKGDLVSVFYRSNANQQWQYQGETGERTGTIMRLANAEATQELSDIVVVYPYNENYYINPRTFNVQASLPAKQTYLANSYGLDGTIMISQSEYKGFSLKNVCGWLKIQLTGTSSQKVSSITLKGNNGEQVAGEIYINSADASCELASESGVMGDDMEVGGTIFEDGTILTSVVLDCGSGVALSSSAKSFYVALPPQTFEKGLTIDIACTDGSTMTKTTENEVVISRNVIQPMTSITYDGVIPEVHELTYTTDDGQPLDPYTTEGFGANFVENSFDAATGKGSLKFDGQITTIPAKAFIACTNLTQINLPVGVTSIAAEAFSTCTALAVMDIPQGVKSIGNKAFYNCSGMTEIAIPSSVTSIGTSSFEGCTGKATINCNIPSAYSSSSRKFYKAKFAEVVLSDSVTSIGREAFYYCSSLTTITIPDSVTSIGYYAFDGCSSLTSVYITDLSAWCKIAFDGSDSNPCYYGAKLYLNGSELTEVTIPSDITEIKDYTFYNCDSLTSVTIPNSVTSIGERAFYNCSSLTSATIGNSVTSIGERAFYNCSSLTSVYITDLSAWCKIAFYDYDSNPCCYGAKLYLNGSELTEVTIPSDITEIKRAAFSGCTSITSVNIHNRVTSIGSGAFYKCGVLTSVTIGNRVTSIGGAAFRDCSSLTSITIPDSVTSIGSYAFEDCSSLTSVTIGNSVTSIGERAFGDCSSLTSVTIGNSVTSIGSNAFLGCSSLKSVYITDLSAWCKIAFSGSSSNPCYNGAKLYLNGSELTEVTIPSDITAIKNLAFYNCDSLTSVTIPDSVTSIGNSAFNSCSSLTSVYCKATTPPTGGYNMFYNNASGRKIYVPTNSVDEYKAAEYWSDYADYIEGKEF